MDFNFTEEKLGQILRGNKEVHAWYDACMEMFPHYEITTMKRVAHFLAQCGHESNNFITLEENLNYSVEGLQRIFKKYFPNAEIAKEYARKPEKIANKVYANRMGNGDEKSGDGWNFHGRGLIQLTGRINYNNYARDTGQTLEQAVDHLNHPHGALESACWFWHTRGLNKIADADDITKLTMRINGGTIGLDDRTAKYKKALEILKK
jgi:putative chitinase